MAERMRPEAAAPGVFPGRAAFGPRQEALLFLPLRWLPDKQERSEKGNPYLHTAGHEAGHLLTAMSLGYSGDVSFEPEGNSLARVTLHGSVPVEDMKTVAAAGMVDTPFGHAFGFSSDKFKIQVMNILHGGKDVSQSRAAAEAALASFGPVRERFSEIIAYYAAYVSPNISADTISKIYQRAMEELAFEGEIPREAGQPTINIKPYDKDIVTVITEHEEYIIVAKSGVADKDMPPESYKICTHCLGINEHHPDCPASKGEAETETKEKWPHPLFSWEARTKQLADPVIGLLGQTLARLQAASSQLV